jgi:hypothetical protein
MDYRLPLRWGTCAAAALAFAIAPTTILTSPTVSTNAGCYNGVTVLNPAGNSCTLPGPVAKIRGSAPDASAIIACRNHPGCLATYVNNP